MTIKGLYLKVSFISRRTMETLGHCLNCEDVISAPILFYAPHCSRQEKVFQCTRKPHDTDTSKSHHRLHLQGEHINETAHGRGWVPMVSSHTRSQTERLRDSQRCLLYSPPRASKNHPQGQNGARHSTY